MYDIPPDFKPISGKRKPPQGWTGYVHFHGGYTDRQNIYSRDQMVWTWTEETRHDWSVVAVKPA